MIKPYITNEYIELCQMLQTYQNTLSSQRSLKNRLVKSFLLIPILSRAASNPSNIKKEHSHNPYFCPKCKYRQQMLKLALNRSYFYYLSDQFERAFLQNLPHNLRNHIRTKNCACGTKDIFLQLWHVLITFMKLLILTQFWYGYPFSIPKLKY